LSKILITNIVQQLKDVLDGDLWIDENFKKKIDKLSATEAFTRPLPNIFSVAELISHIFVWRKQIMKRLNRLHSGRASEIPDYWKGNDELKKIGWIKLKNNFYESQYELIRLIENKDDKYLKKKYSNSRYTFKYLIDGMIHHDLYHLGQIGITIKLLNKKKNNR
jgi:uncharacterized damage-inducible protein DinB